MWICKEALQSTALAAIDPFWLPQAPIPALLQLLGSCPLLEQESPAAVSAGQSKSKELVGMVTPLPPAVTGRTGERSHSWWDVHTAWGLLHGVFLFVPFNATRNPRKAINRRSSASETCKHCLPGVLRMKYLPVLSCVNTSGPNSVGRQSVLEYFYFVNYTA